MPSSCLIIVCIQLLDNRFLALAHHIPEDIITLIIFSDETAANAMSNRFEDMRKRSTKYN